MESLCNNVQKLIHKVFSPDKVTEIVQKMKGLHIRIVMSFIYGFPGVSQDDFEVCMPYFEKWKSINPEVYYQCGFYTPYPGTPMTEKAVSLGYSLPKNLEEYGDFDVYYGLENKNIELPWMKKEYCINYINNIKKKFPSHNGVFELWEKRKKNKLPAFQKEES